MIAIPSFAYVHFTKHPYDILVLIWSWHWCDRNRFTELWSNYFKSIWYDLHQPLLSVTSIKNEWLSSLVKQQVLGWISTLVLSICWSLFKCFCIQFIVVLFKFIVVQFIVVLWITVMICFKLRVNSILSYRIGKSVCTLVGSHYNRRVIRFLWTEWDIYKRSAYSQSANRSYANNKDVSNYWHIRYNKNV